MEKAKILLVEDEPDLAEPLVEGLTEEGFEVRHAIDGGQALRLLKRDWNLLILDLALPDIPGETIVEHVKQRPDPPAILIITARAEIEDKLLLFRRGCDDYLTKPFIFDELLERVKALLRRPTRVVPEVCCYESLALDPLTHILTGRGETIELTPTETGICRLMMTEPGRVVSRKEILRVIWGMDAEPNSNLIGIHTYNFRKKLASIGYEDWFHTVRTSGFILCKPAEAIEPGVDSFRVTPGQT